MHKVVKRHPDVRDVGATSKEMPPAPEGLPQTVRTNSNTRAVPQPRFRVTKSQTQGREDLDLNRPAFRRATNTVSQGGGASNEYL